MQQAGPVGVYRMFNPYLRKANTALKFVSQVSTSLQYFQRLLIIKTFLILVVNGRVIGFSLLIVTLFQFLIFI